MEQFNYQYTIRSKRQQLPNENCDANEGPTTSDQLEVELNSVPCNVCKRNFSSEKALWGHRRCCKPARAENRNEIGCVSGFKHDVLESGWHATAKRGRKQTLDITSPEFVAASILIDIARGKSIKKAKIEESQPSSDSPIAQPECSKIFVCVTCGKEFPSYQALGGHRGSHGKDGMTVTSAKDEGEMKHSKELASEGHRCEICGASYLSGQALGGHKRKHWMGGAYFAG